jgi:hypothetical protein
VRHAITCHTADRSALTLTHGGAPLPRTLSLVFRLPLPPAISYYSAARSAGRSINTITMSMSHNKHAAEAGCVIVINEMLIALSVLHYCARTGTGA